MPWCMAPEPYVQPIIYARPVRLIPGSLDGENVARMQQSAVGVCRHLKARRMRRAIHRRDIVETNLDLVLDVVALPLRMFARQKPGKLTRQKIGGPGFPGTNLFHVALLIDGADARIDRLKVHPLVELSINMETRNADADHPVNDKTHV